MNHLLKNTVLSALGVLALTAPSFAQCPKPDQLDGGPCCTLAKLDLPKFPGFKQSSLDLCWKDCNVDQQRKVTARWSSPYSPGTLPSNDKSSVLRIRDSSGALIWRGRFTLAYSRTWFEVDATGMQVQVWRFLANGDLRHTSAAGGSPCPVPSCAASHGRRVRHTGYVDWAYDCANNRWSNAWMLSHACDQFEHVPGFPRGGSFHPDRAFSFVGPAAGFVPSPLTPVETGADKFEAIRRVVRPSAGFGFPVPISQYEEPATFQVVNQSQFCACSPGGQLSQYAYANMVIDGACGTKVMSGGQLLGGFISMSIGSWTDPGTYPGMEVMRWNIAEYNYFEPCTQAQTMEIFHGVTTMRGNQAFTLNSSPNSVPLPQVFIDQCNALRHTTMIMNVPFKSDHILNLNHW